VDNDQWTTVFVDEIYYKDFWAGPIEPQQRGIVFSTRFILPEYLRAVYVALVVTGAFDPGVVDPHSPDFRDFKVEWQSWADTLLWVHNTAKDGMVPVRPPSPDQLWYDDQGFLMDGVPGRFVLSVWTAADPYYIGIPYNPDPEFAQWYGAVDRYTGLSSAGNYPGVLPDPSGTPPSKAFFDQFYAKYNLAVIKRWKDVYIGLGLPYVWKTINLLRELSGDPPLPGADASHWSLREVYRAVEKVLLLDAITTIKQVSYLRTSVVLSTVVALRGLLGDRDTVKRPASWREQIQALPFPDAGVQVSLGVAH
jgi:hypothetical protein